MSFILDALKKAEAERQRQTGPTLLEVRVAQPRRRFPAWMFVIGVLLTINILLLILFVLRRPSADTPPTTNAMPPASAPLAAAAIAAPAAAPMSAPAVAAPATAAPTAVAPPVNTSPSGNPGYATNTAPATTPDAADQSGDNPADFEPAVPSTAQRARPPSLSDIGGNMPDLRLDLHVYAARPSDRYALINMHRVHEGDVLPEGPRVVAIDRDGVELTYRGTDFMLHPQ